MRAHTLALALWLFGSTLFAQTPSPSPGTAASEVFSLKKRHLVLMWATAQRLAQVDERRLRNEPVDWDRIAKWLKSVVDLDRELSLREAILRVPPGGLFAQRLERVQAIVQQRAARLQAFSSAPLLPEGAFSAPDVPAQPAKPETAAQARARLRGRPSGSIVNMFGASAGIKKQALPAKKPR